MASPRSAWASAAASLTPSPTIATTRPCVLQPLDHVDLVRGQHVGDDLVDADLARHRPGGAVVVAGEQHRAQPEAAQPLHGLGGGRLDGVRDHEHAPGPAVPADRDRRTALRLRGLDGRGEVVAQRLPVLGQQPRSPDDHPAPLDDPLRAQAGQVRNSSTAGRRETAAPVTTARAIGCSEPASRAAARRQYRLRGLALGGHHVDQRHPAGGHRAGLVEHDGVDAPGRLEDLGAP